MAATTFAEVTALVRKVADDRDQGGGLVFTDAELLDFGTSVQRELYTKMAVAGLMASQGQITKTITPSDTAITATLPVGQTLPDDLLVPEKLWEKPQGDPDTSYEEMSDASEIIPDVQAGDRILYWVFQDGEIRFYRAPTTNRTVRILYRKEAPTINSGASVLYVRGSVNAMAWGVLRFCAASRGESTLANSYEAKYREATDDLLRLYGKGEQRRRRLITPYSQMIRNRW